MPELKNPKHEAVLRAFVADNERVAWRAYASVYTDVTENAARAAASRLFKGVNIAARLKELENAITDKVVEKTGITIERVIAELAEIAFSNMTDYMVIGADGAPRLDFSRLSRNQAAAIQELVVDSIGPAPKPAKKNEKKPAKGKSKSKPKALPAVLRVKFKLYDKRAALVDIGRQLGAFKSTHELTGKDGKPIETKDVSELGDLEIARRIAFVLEKAARGAASKKPKR